MAQDERPAGIGVMPHLTIRGGNAAEAIDFYARAFGASESGRHMAEDGKRIMHAHLTFNGVAMMLNDDFPEMGGGHESGRPPGCTLHLQVDDADAWWDRAIEAGFRFSLGKSNETQTAVWSQCSRSTRPSSGSSTSLRSRGASSKFK